MRWVWIGPLRFEEEITAYEAPRRLDYVIRRVRTLPFRHEGGSIVLEPDGADAVRLRVARPRELRPPDPLEAVVAGVVRHLPEDRGGRGVQPPLHPDRPSHPAARPTRRCARSPWCPISISTWAGPSKPLIQCGVQVLNSAASPGSSTRSSSPRTRRSLPLST